MHENNNENVAVAENDSVEVENGKKGSVIELLSKKIDEVLARIKAVEEENNNLRNEIVALKAQNEAKDAQIAKLDEELMMKDLEIEEVIGKIETMLSE